MTTCLRTGRPLEEEADQATLDEQRSAAGRRSGTDDERSSKHHASSSREVALGDRARARVVSRAANFENRVPMNPLTWFT